jgi:hypothetical protein
MDTQLRTSKQTSEYAVEAPVTFRHQNIQDSAISQKVNADGSLGLSRSCPSTLPRMWNHSNKCKVF